MVCLDDFERYASQVLPKYAYDYYRSGADDQITLAENVEAFRRFVDVDVRTKIDPLSKLTRRLRAYRLL
jgi:isopentenyl diphosphate isomerase/L-lactate dehydrogenase-like FMN-dependent dehydrogenase